MNHDRLMHQAGREMRCKRLLRPIGESLHAPMRLRDGRDVRAAPPATTLTPREIEILRLIADGRENAEIAELLVISPSTAKNHVAHVLDKLGVENRVQAAVYAVRNGLV